MASRTECSHGLPEENLLVPELLNAAFCPIRSEGFDFNKLLPKLYKPCYNPAQNNLVVRRDGVLQAAVGLYYNTLHLGESTLKVGGIGNVAVLPEARKRGYMQECMNLALADAGKEGADLLFLDGQRQRYGYFGFFHGGICVQLCLTPQAVLHAFGRDAQTRLVLREIHENDTALLDKCAALHAKQCYRFDRKREMLFDILVSWLGNAFALMEGDTFRGYLIFNEERDCITEWKLTDNAYLKDAALAAHYAFDARRKTVRLPEWETETIRFLSDFCEQIQVSYAEMIAVLNWKKTVEALLRFRASYKRLCDCDTVLLIHGFLGDETLHITVKDNAVSVTDTGTPALALSPLAAARLLFGPLPQETDLSPAFLANLPLPFYVYSADNV